MRHLPLGSGYHVVGIATGGNSKLYWVVYASLLFVVSYLVDSGEILFIKPFPVILKICPNKTGSPDHRCLNRLFSLGLVRPDCRLVESWAGRRSNLHGCNVWCGVQTCVVSCSERDSPISRRSSSRRRGRINQVITSYVAVGRG